MLCMQLTALPRCLGARTGQRTRAADGSIYAVSVQWTTHGAGSIQGGAHLLALPRRPAECCLQGRDQALVQLW